MEVWQRLDLIFIFDFFVCQYLASPSIECNVGFVLHNTSLSCPRNIISGLFHYFFRWLFCGIDGLQLPDEPENLATVFANLDPPKLSCPTQIQMEKNTGANTTTSQIQTANTSKNHEETLFPKQYNWQLVVIAIFCPLELSSAVLWTNPSFTAAVRLNLICDSCFSINCKLCSKWRQMKSYS